MALTKKMAHPQDLLLGYCDHIICRSGKNYYTSGVNLWEWPHGHSLLRMIAEGRV